MIINFKYCRDEKNRPLITICEIEGESRGIAICSPLDNPNKKKGRKIAFDRASHSSAKGTSCLAISRTEALEVLEKCNAQYDFKAEAL